MHLGILGCCDPGNGQVNALQASAGVFKFHVTFSVIPSEAERVSLELLY